MKDLCDAPHRIISEACRLHVDCMWIAHGFHHSSSATMSNTQPAAATAAATANEGSPFRLLSPRRWWVNPFSPSRNDSGTNNDATTHDDNNINLISVATPPAVAATPVAASAATTRATPAAAFAVAAIATTPAIVVTTAAAAAGDVTTPSPSAAAAAAAAAATGQGLMMPISTVRREARAKSPIISTANQVNAKTTAKKKSNKQGEVVAAIKDRVQRISVGCRVFSERSKLIKTVKQGDPAYEIINNVGNGFRFYGTVIKADGRKGCWHIEYDLFPEEAKSLRVTRQQCSTLLPGSEEPQYDPRQDKVNQALAELENIEIEPDDCDLVLQESSDDDDAAGSSTNKTKKKKKKSKKVLSLESFMDMSDEGVRAATSFNHYYGECDNDFIEWTILMEGSEISEDVMKHSPKDTSPFKANLQWMPETSKVDFFDIFFRHFFPSLEGKAAILDKYLSNPRCSGHTKYWVNENVRFHRPDHPDPDYIVSFVLIATPPYISDLTLCLLSHIAEDLCDTCDCCKSRS